MGRLGCHVAYDCGPAMSLSSVGGAVIVSGETKGWQRGRARGGGRAFAPGCSRGGAQNGLVEKHFENLYFTRMNISGSKTNGE